MIPWAGATIWGTVYVLGRLHGLTVEEIREAVPDSTPLPQSIEDWETIDHALGAEASRLSQLARGIREVI